MSVVNIGLTGYEPLLQSAILVDSPRLAPFPFYRVIAVFPSFGVTDNHELLLDHAKMVRCEDTLLVRIGKLGRLSERLTQNNTDFPSIRSNYIDSRLLRHVQHLPEVAWAFTNFPQNTKKRKLELSLCKTQP